jgi:hypothetical protein
MAPGIAMDLHLAAARAVVAAFRVVHRAAIAAAGVQGATAMDRAIVQVAVLVGALAAAEVVAAALVEGRAVLVPRVSSMIAVEAAAGMAVRAKARAADLVAATVAEVEVEVEVDTAVAAAAEVVHTTARVARMQVGDLHHPAAVSMQASAAVSMSLTPPRPTSGSAFASSMKTTTWWSLISPPASSLHPCPARPSTRARNCASTASLAS